MRTMKGMGVNHDLNFCEQKKINVLDNFRREFGDVFTQTCSPEFEAYAGSEFSEIKEGFHMIFKGLGERISEIESDASMREFEIRCDEMDKEDGLI